MWDLQLLSLSTLTFLKHFTLALTRTQQIDELHIRYFAAFWNRPIIRIVRSIRGQKVWHYNIVLHMGLLCVFWEEGGPGAGSRADMPPFCGNYWPGQGEASARELFTGGGYGAIKIIRYVDQSPGRDDGGIWPANEMLSKPNNGALNIEDETKVVFKTLCHWWWLFSE